MNDTKLTDLITALMQADVKDDDAFARLVSASMLKLHLEDKDLALEFSASRPTVTRWRNGTNAPHPAMRKPIFQYLQARLEKVKRQEERAAKPKPVLTGRLAGKGQRPHAAFAGADADAE